MVWGSHHGCARRVRDGYSVDAEKRFRTLKLEFRASTLPKLEFKGRFELLSARASCWCAWQHLEVKMSKVSLKKHAFGLPVEH